MAEGEEGLRPPDRYGHPCCRGVEPEPRDPGGVDVLSEGSALTKTESRGDLDPSGGTFWCQLFT